VPDAGFSGSLSRSDLLASPIPLFACAHTYPAVAASLRVHVGIGHIVGMSLRTVSLLGSWIHGSISRSITSWRYSLKVRWIYATSVRAVLPARTFLGVVTGVIHDQSLGDGTPGHLVRDDVRLAGPTAYVDGAVPLSERAVPRPTLIIYASINERPEARHGVSEGWGAPPPFRGAVPTQSQVVRIAECVLLDMDQISAAVYSAHRFSHV
jgi:hypothetical protein